MRTVSPYITNLWNRSGPFIGADRAHARVTVEKNWFLNLESSVDAEDPSKLPFRWFQHINNAQVETEIPNVQSISWDRSLDSDAASCQISIYNQKMDPNMSGQNRRLGTRGYYTWRARNGEALARWPESLNNEWTEVLIPNALIRTYEGYGGHGKTVDQAVADGNLYLTGVWLIDEVRTSSDGMLNISCRDMCKLLIEQQLYVPLMPRAKYPLAYYRWRFETQLYPAIPYYDRYDPGWPDGPFFGPGNEGRKWAPDIGIDALGDGYAIVGTDGGVFCYDTPFFGSRGLGAVGGVVGMAKRPQNDGLWAVDRNGQVFTLGAAPNHGGPASVVAPIVRIAATHTGNGYWLLDETGDVYTFGDAAYLGSFPEGAPKFTDMHGTHTGAGYWLLAENGAVYAYGNATHHGNAAVLAGQKATGIAPTPAGGGYWICATDGAVYAHGNAVYHGRVTNPNAPIKAIVATSTGNGYWLLGQDGGVFSFGDATFHGSMPPAAGALTDMAARDGGYWLIGDNGQTHPYGAATDFGDIVPGIDPTPMRGIAMDPLGRGYWLAAEDGAVYAFGEVGFYGRAFNPNGIITRIVATPNGRGYWLLGSDGGVFSFGNAGFHGSAVGFIIGAAVDMARTETGLGYWILGEQGHVYAFGDAEHRGNAPIAAGDYAVGIAARPQGDGYWIVSQKAQMYGFGAAVAYPAMPAHGDWAAKLGQLNDPIFSIDAMPDGNGVVLVGGDGGVFTFGSAVFEGSLPGAFQSTKRFEGNYSDLTEIVKDLLLWSGWLLQGTGRADVFGNIEYTGTFVEEDLPADIFDKKPVIDAINAIRDIVGFEFWIDEEGGARFESPNWYTYGNFMQETGARVSTIPEIDERVSLTSYTLSHVDRPIRSQVIITSDDPLAGNETTITTILEVQSKLLRGMVRPAIIPTPFQVTKADQECMAVLIEQYMGFQILQGSLTCVANPALQVNDQVRIFEQISAETDVHFVRGISSSHDLDTGVWTYTLTTNRLGAGREAATTGNIVSCGVPASSSVRSRPLV